MHPVLGRRIIKGGTEKNLTSLDLLLRQGLNILMGRDWGQPDFR